MLGRIRGITLLAFAASLILVLGSYCLCSSEDILGDSETHLVYGFIYLGLGMLFTIVLPSTCIASEKESRSWPILLTTALNDRAILFGKFAGALWRCLPIWLLLLGHTIAFGFAGILHPLAITYMTILILWVAIFLCGSGLYFSSRCRRTTTAVILNFALALTIWGIVPLLLFFAAGARTSHYYLDANPVVHLGATMDATKSSGFSWIGLGHRGIFETTIWVIACTVVYVLLGFLFAWRAKCRLRGSIF